MNKKAKKGLFFKPLPWFLISAFAAAILWFHFAERVLGH